MLLPGKWCLTELWPTFDFINSTTRPGITLQSFSPEPCEQCQWFSAVKVVHLSHIKIFLAYTTFFFNFLKIPYSSLFLMPISSKSQFSSLFLMPISSNSIFMTNAPNHRHAAYYQPIENVIGIPWNFLCKCSDIQSMSHKNFMREFQFSWGWC